MGKKAPIDLSKTFHRVTPDGDKAISKEKEKKIIRKPGAVAEFFKKGKGRIQISRGPEKGPCKGPSKGKC